MATKHHRVILDLALSLGYPCAATAPWPIDRLHAGHGRATWPAKAAP